MWFLNDHGASRNRINKSAAKLIVAGLDGSLESRGESRTGPSLVQHTWPTGYPNDADRNRFRALSSPEGAP